MIYIYAFCFMFASFAMVKHNVNMANMLLYIDVALIIVGTICDTIIRVSANICQKKGDNNNENKSVNQ